MLGQNEKNDVAKDSIRRREYIEKKKPPADPRFTKELNTMQLAQLEHMAIRKLSTAVAPYGLDFAEAVNIWVALKSKPALIFCGSSSVDLFNLANSISKAFVEQDSNQFRTFLGHPWWASESQRPSLYIAAQQRFTSIRFRSFLDEVASLGETEKLYFALLNGISRLELREFFVDIQRQVDTFGGVLELPLDMASAPTTIPKNFLLLATIKLDGTLIEDGDVLNNSSVIYLEHKPSAFAPLLETNDVAHQTMQMVLKRRSNFSLSASFETIKKLNQVHNQVKPLLHFLSLVSEYDVGSRNGLVRDAILYMANAWDVNGRGLFNERPTVNIQRVTDLWLLQSAVPRLMKVIRTEPKIRADVVRFLDRSFPLASRRIAQGKNFS